MYTLILKQRPYSGTVSGNGGTDLPTGENFPPIWSIFYEKGRSIHEKGGSIYEKGRSIHEKGRSIHEKGRSFHEWDGTCSGIHQTMSVTGN
jgi:hypothetical protein